MFITPMMWIIMGRSIWDVSRPTGCFPRECRTVIIATHDVLRASRVRDVLTEMVVPGTDILVLDKSDVFRDGRVKKSHDEGHLVVVTIYGEDEETVLKGDYQVIDAFKTNVF